MVDIATLAIQVKTEGVQQANAQMSSLASNSEKAERATDKLGSSFAGATRYMIAAAASLAAMGLAAFIKSCIDAQLQVERLGRLLNAAAGNANLGGREMEYAREMTKKFGLDLASTTESYGKFMAAIRGTTMEGEKGRRVFESVAGASTALGLRADETAGIFKALEQMISKGKVQMEELRGQLGERLPGAFKMAADAMGVSTAELDKNLAAGKVMADELLPKLAAELDKTYGKAAVEGARSAQAEINRFNNALFESKAAVGSALMPAMSDILSSLMPVIEMVRDAIKAFQQLAVSYAVTMDKISAAEEVGWFGLMTKSGRAQYKQAASNAETAGYQQFLEIENRYNRPASTGYTPAEILRQSQNKGVTPAGKGGGGVDSAEQWRKTYADLRKEVDALVPGLDEYAKKISDIDNKYTDLMHKKGADIVILQRLREEHLKAIEVQRQVDATSKEFKGIADAEQEAANLVQAQQEIEDWNRSVREMVTALDPAVKKEREFADGIYDINRAFGEDGAAAIDAYTNAFFKLAEVQAANQELDISLIEDPYEQQRATMIKFYDDEQKKIEENLKILKDAGKERTDIYKELIAKQDKLDAARAQKTKQISEDETNSKLSLVSNYTGIAAGLFVALADTQDQSSRKGFESAKAFNIAAAVMSTAAAVMNALATVQPYPLAIVAAASAAATGVIQIAKIASTSFGGGGSVETVVPGFSGGSAGMGGSVGGSIGGPTLSIQDQATAEAMQQLANSANSASLALGKVADGMTSIAGLFESDQSKLLGSSLMSSRSGSTGLRITGGTSGLDITRQTTQGGGGGVGQGLQSTIEGYIQQIQSTIIRAAVVTGTTADMDSVSIPTGKIRTDTNQATKIQKQFEEWLTKVADQLAQTTDGLKEFTYYGESAFDAIVRLSTALQSVNESLELIGADLITSTLAGANAAYQLQELMGGSEDFTDKITGYFETMFTEDEQAAMKAEQAQRQVSVAFNEMNASINSLGWSIPTTRQEFVGLVNGLDLTTENGRALFAALMDIAPAFDTVQTQMEDLAAKAAELAIAQEQLNDSLAVRALRLGGNNSMADLLDAVISAENDIKAAREQGLDVTLLEKITYDELVKSINDKYLTATDSYSAALNSLNNVLVEGARTTLAEWQKSAQTYETIADSLKKSRLALMTGNLSSGSLEDRLRESKTQLWGMYGNGMRGDQESLQGLSTAVNSYLQLAQQYYASSPGYAVEYDTVMGMLQSAEGKATSQVNYAQRQADLQQQIIDKMTKSDEEQKKDRAEQLKENVAQTQALMEGFKQMIALLSQSGGSLETIESVLIQKAAA
jgi:tape measure domain-containing protein